MTEPRTFDAREVPMIKRIGAVLQAVESLRPGETVMLINDIDPRPLKLKIGNRYTWDYLEQGPEVYRIKITHKV